MRSLTRFSNADLPFEFLARSLAIVKRHQHLGIRFACRVIAFGARSYPLPITVTRDQTILSHPRPEMAASPRFLLSQLPPELRNEIYSYLSTDNDDSSVTNKGLPLQLKEYECKHMKIEICPVHFGSTSLIALQSYRFLEAHEYRTWLLNNALALQIKVVFKGSVNTFVQADWDKKIGTYLRKLSARYPWLTKVATYRICVRWDATGGVLKSKKKERTAGRIPRDMVRTLTQLMDEKIKRDRGDVIVRLVLEHRITVENVLSRTMFGLRDFLVPLQGDEEFKRTTMDIWKTPPAPIVPESPCLPFIPVAVSQGEKKLLHCEQGLDHGMCVGPGHLVIRKTVESGKPIHALVGNVQRELDTGPDYVLTQLLEECLDNT